VQYGFTSMDSARAVCEGPVTEGSIEEVLRTALDLCLGVGSFVVTMTGTVHRALCDAMPPDDGWRRLEALARDCLSHPAASGRDVFWNAEVSTEAGSVDRSLACVVVPVWSADHELGLLGVADTWLPEPDEYQLSGLASLGAALSRLLAHRSGSQLPEVSGPPADEGVGPPGAPAEHQDASRRGATAASLGDPGIPERRWGGRAAVQIDAAELVSSLDDGILCLDASGTVVLTNRTADALHGLPPERTLLGAPLPMTSGLRTEDGQVLAHDRHPALLALEEGAVREAHLTVGQEGDGERHVAVTARPFPVEGRRGVLVVMHDTTDEWMEQQRLSHYALYDPLTGLANRYLLLEELRRMLQGLGRRGGSVALVYTDLDDFKRINDEHGHDMGDEVLSAFARRLRGAVRSDDVVARLGGDEFVIAHATAEEPPDGDLVVSRLRKVLSAPFTVRGIAFDVGASIGWVSTEKGDVAPDALLARADRAMYQHKRDRAMSRRPAP